MHVKAKAVLQNTDVFLFLLFPEGVMEGEGRLLCD